MVNNFDPPVERNAIYLQSKPVSFHVVLFSDVRSYQEVEEVGFIALYVSMMRR